MDQAETKTTAITQTEPWQHRRLPTLPARLCSLNPVTIGTLTTHDRNALLGHRRALEAWTAPSPTAQQAAILGQISRMPTQSKNQDDWRVVMQMLIADTAEYPADILYEAVTKLRRTQTFMPDAAQIRAAADPLLAARRRDIERIDLLLAPAETPVKVDRTARAALIREMVPGYDSKKSMMESPPAHMPPAPPPDETLL